ncbi:MAG: S8 family serine peptidase [Chitinophagales bacterium]|nr:S8 family serine peptidase [Chitinophagales bacterium]
MNKMLLIIFFCSTLLTVFAKNQIIVSFNNKGTQIKTEDYNATSLEKRNQNNIAFNYTDFPINESYIQKIENLNCKLKAKSKWLNLALFDIEDKAVITEIQQLSFVKQVQFIPSTTSNKSLEKLNTNNKTFNNARLLYDDTLTYGQIHQMNGDYLHDLGFNGQGKIIAVLDAGFINANVITGLQTVFNNNQVLGTWDFVQNDTTVYESHTHGLYVFGLMAGQITGKYKGTATQSNYYLFKTENAASELLSEEVFLAQALEQCDALGVDVVNISLGYTTFDSVAQNHSYADLDGNTTIAAQAVNLATSKGILVVTSAGNEGNNSWRYISTPADATGALTVGAVYINGLPTSFTSKCFPNYFQVKPNVAACGANDYILSPYNTIGTGSGTSFSSPLVAGMSASLWQAFPTLNNLQIKAAIEQSASLYPSFDSLIGYGIPDFKKAYEYLQQITPINQNRLSNIKIYPTLIVNNSNNIFINNLIDNQSTLIYIINNQGRIMYSTGNFIANTNEMIPSNQISQLSSGLYHIIIQQNGKSNNFKFVKQ